MSKTLRIVAISDTHAQHRAVDVPDGDVLIHAGDMTRHGDLDEVRDLNDFLGGLPHRVKLVIAGNHDFCFQDDREQAAALLSNCVYLQDEAFEFDGLAIWGSPWQPWFHDWAFNLERGAALRAKWDLIPAGTDILITHGPPAGHGDRTARGEAVGCRDLLEAVERLRPRLHVFGHIHEAAGVTRNEHTTFVNACSCDLRYRPSLPAIVHELSV